MTSSWLGNNSFLSDTAITYTVWSATKLSSVLGFPALGEHLSMEVGRHDVKTPLSATVETMTVKNLRLN